MREKVKKLVPYLFFSCLLTFMILSIYEYIWPKSVSLYFNINYFIIFVVILSTLTFYYNREVITKIEEEVIGKQKEEDKRKLEFSKKFPIINKIPLIKDVIKWMYKEGWEYSFSLIVIILISGFLFTYNLGGYDFREDEYPSIDAAAGYYYTTTFYKWDWLENRSGQHSIDCIENDPYCNYTRAWPHLLLIVSSYKIFGISEWSSRIISALFGILFIFISYFIAKFFIGNKLVSIFISLSFTFYYQYINLFRYTRMYAVLLPIFLILFYFLYKSITGNNRINFKNKVINGFINKNLDYNYIALFIALPILYLNYIVNITSLIILPIVFLFLIYMAITKKKKKYIILSSIGIIILITSIFVYYLGLTDKFLELLSFFGRYNIRYLEWLVQFPFIWKVGLIFIISGFFLIFFSKDILRDKLIYFYITLIFSLIFFVYIGNRYASFLYISHVTPIAIMVILANYFFFIKIVHSRTIKMILVFILIFSIGIQFYSNYEKIYGDEHRYGKFSEAYKSIVKNYNPEKEVIFGQYLRKYYLKEIAENLTFINMLNNKRYQYETFLEDINKYDSGWVIWETRKSYHIRKDIRAYIDKNFKKYHGEGIDDTRVEVYYFNKTMIERI